MTLTIGLCGAAILAILLFVGYRLVKNTPVADTPPVMRVTRKNRPLRKPTRDHVGKRAEVPHGAHHSRSEP